METYNESFELLDQRSSQISLPSLSGLLWDGTFVVDLVFDIFSIEEKKNTFEFGRQVNPSTIKYKE